MQKDSAQKQRVLVWGACGFIGRHLVSRLLAEGASVRVLTWSRSRYEAPEWASAVEWFELSGSPADDAVLEEAIAASDIIYNLAGSSGAVASNRDPLHSLETICRSQLEFLRACEGTGSRPHVVFASSRLVYGRPARLPVSEEAPLAPLSMYAVHKISAESYHQIYGRRGAITFAICRMSNPYGAEKQPRAKGYGVINALIRQAVEGRPMTIYGDGRQQRDYIHIRDLVTALWLAGCRSEARNEIFNIGRGTGITLREAAETIQQLTGCPELRFAPWPAEDLSVESGDFVADIRKAKRLLGFAPEYDFLAGVRQVLEEITATADMESSATVAHSPCCNDLEDYEESRLT